MDRVEVRLGGDDGARYEGVLMALGQARPLPPGSTLDRRLGLLVWNPGPGFIGAHTLEFVRTLPHGARERVPLTVHIVPRFQVNTKSRMWIDTPGHGDMVAVPFEISGWARRPYGVGGIATVIASGNNGPQEARSPGPPAFPRSSALDRRRKPISSQPSRTRHRF